MDRWRIAIVDDDLLVRKSLERLLRSHGYEPRCYASAAEFLEQSGDNSLTCLLLDLCMPGMSGTDLYQRLRKDGHEVPTIFMSAHEDELHRASTLLPAVDDHLHKPFDDGQLLSAIRRVAGGEASPD
jgi:FixJ family two-component response regulator